MADVEAIGPQQLHYVARSSRRSKDALETARSLRPREGRPPTGRLVAGDMEAGVRVEARGIDGEVDGDPFQGEAALADVGPDLHVGVGHLDTDVRPRRASSRGGRWLLRLAVVSRSAASRPW